jgi:hypothetical protein
MTSAALQCAVRVEDVSHGCPPDVRPLTTLLMILVVLDLLFSPRWPVVLATLVVVLTVIVRVIIVLHSMTSGSCVVC